MLGRVTAFIAVTLMLTGCDEHTLPPAPDNLDRGISIYADANYLGVSAQITSDIGDLKSFTGPCAHEIEYGAIQDWNDCVSSIHVAPGWRAIVFRDDDFSGQRTRRESVPSGVPRSLTATRRVAEPGTPIPVEAL